MSARPTPEQRKQIILDIVDETIDGLQTVCDDPYLHGRLASIEDYLHGCVIVHPDDPIPVTRIHLDTDSNRTFAHIEIAADEQEDCPDCATRPDASFHDPEAEPCHRCGDTGYITTAEQETP